MIYGYARVSTKSQDLTRQIRNIMAYGADKRTGEGGVDRKKIYTDKYTGTKIDRPGFDKLLKVVKAGDTLVFDEVSRLSRDADDGVRVYNDLMNKGVNLVFLKNPQMDTDVIKKANENLIPMTGTKIDCILKGINEYMGILVEEQIRASFEKAQDERDFLSIRTKEGQDVARANGKQIGQPRGTKLHSKKGDKCKEAILKYSKDFNGTLGDQEVMTLAGVSRNTYYKYKRELNEQ